jgi:oligopeptide/dipeptide ABC transporter ATP-binding protein
MSAPSKLLEMRNVSVRVSGGKTPRNLIRGVNLSVAPNEIAAIVGESGSGKTVTTQTILRLLDPTRCIISGAILYEGRNILDMSPSALRTLRAKGIGMIFQDPMTSLNPLLRIGYQITESLRHLGTAQDVCTARALELMSLVGLRDPQSLMKAYPHELSGGMRQRVMIATALMGGPKLLIADEPTTALDVTVQAQFLELLQDIRRKTGIAILLITHDLGVVSTVADSVYVMYGGEIVEHGAMSPVLSMPAHPYTSALLQSTPQPGARRGGKRPRLQEIPGVVPADPLSTSGCVFHDRCAFAKVKCWEEAPPPSGSRDLRCHYPLIDLTAEATQ